MSEQALAAITSLQAAVASLQAQVCAFHAQPASELKVKLAVNEKGQCFAAGMGLGAGEAAPGPFDVVMSKGAGAVLEYLTAQISDAQLGLELLAVAQADAVAADAVQADRIAQVVRETMRRELNPGGMLSRR